MLFYNVGIRTRLSDVSLVSRAACGRCGGRATAVLSGGHADVLQQLC